MCSFVQVTPRTCLPDPRGMVLNQDWALPCAPRGMEVGSVEEYAGLQRPGRSKAGGARSGGRQQDLAGNPRALLAETSVPAAG